MCGNIMGKTEESGVHMSDERQYTASDKTLIVLQEAIKYERFSDIVNATGFAKATVHRILKSLVEFGFISISESGEYFAGPASLQLAGEAFRNIDISQIAAPHLSKLSSTLGYTAHVGALNQFEAIYIAKQSGATPYSIPSGVGQSMHLHSTAIGKCLLSGFTTEELEGYLSSVELVAKTPNTIVNQDALRRELDSVRERGFSLDDEENVPGIRCIGAPIFDHSGRISHAISMTSLALENSVEEVCEFAPVILEIAQAISTDLGAPSSSLRR